MAKKAEKPAVGTEKPDQEGKAKALGLAMEQITKQFGDGSIMKLGESKKVDVELLPSGALSLDIALGGGYPKGRSTCRGGYGRQAPRDRRSYLVPIAPWPNRSRAPGRAPRNRFRAPASRSR